MEAEWATGSGSMSEEGSESETEAEWATGSGPESGPESGSKSESVTKWEPESP